MSKSLTSFEGEVVPNSVEQIKQLLGKLLRVSVTDGRVLEGEFLCLDRELNIILGNACEFM